ncbi:MAG: ABC transporter permease [Spirochaetaceae bacterium]|nr:ABC transporter permease [Spirochaetaceae bacterium]
MIIYIFKRILIIFPTFLGITILVFFISSLMPGGPLELLLSDPHISRDEIERQKLAFGLDQPVPIRYIKWLGSFLGGNLGVSYRTKRQIMGMIMERLPNTLVLSGTALLLAIITSIPLGVFAASKPYSVRDYFISGAASFLASTPGFFVGLVFIYLWVVRLRILPLGGMYDISKPKTIFVFLRHLLMPAVVLSLSHTGSLTRYMRGSMMEVLHSDYIRSARGKGLTRKKVIVFHGLKNAMIPMVTNIGLSLPLLVSGAVITEQMFSWPGIGTLMIQSINSRDYPAIMGITSLITVVVLLGNLLTDVVYGFLDPRISYR